MYSANISSNAGRHRRTGAERADGVKELPVHHRGWDIGSEVKPRVQQNVPWQRQLFFHQPPLSRRQVLLRRQKQLDLDAERLRVAVGEPASHFRQRRWGRHPQRTSEGPPRLVQQRPSLVGVIRVGGQPLRIALGPRRCQARQRCGVTLQHLGDEPLRVDGQVQRPTHPDVAQRLPLPPGRGAPPAARAAAR